MGTAATTIKVRASVEERELVDRAATAQGKTRTDFILQASVEAAGRVLLDRVFSEIDEERIKALDTVMSQPVGNNEAVRRLLVKNSPWDR
ncbi:DUF1778 domain-containing protein [Caldimonas brevitalea]|uniref:DUF1778 domain-containing protein n=1 Tax=Caldimonas brevitalea TaxID=413882 RepID=A0A0G3BFY3_9BURK|nr:DUF1778 domain-containing protein [Caldimonas brevitalea]AKJ26863.1 hypothetical protein AAW51_0172 [Caldimonas brevitalea]